MTRAPHRTVALAVALAALAAIYPPTGGTIRLHILGDPWDPTPSGLQAPADLVLSDAVFARLVEPGPDGALRPGVALSWGRSEPGAEEGDLWMIRLDPLARFPDGRRVTPGDVIASWERLLRSPGSSYRFLLGPVVGASAFAGGAADEIAGLLPRGEELWIALSRPTPDLPLRLAHPALSVGVVDRLGVPRGPGPFRADGGGSWLGPNPFHARGRPFLEGVSLVEADGVDPSLLVEAGEAHAAMLFGRAAGTLLDRSPVGVQLRRSPGWDRVYALSLNPASGFVSRQISFREFLERAIDREEMVRLLFGGRGEAVGSLLREGPMPPAPTPVPSLPGTKQRLVLSFDRTDPLAASIAARLKAAWEEVQLMIDLDGVEPPTLRDRMLRGEHHVALVLHQPPTSDPVLALRGTLGVLGAGHEDAVDALRRAEALADPGSRWEAAAAAEARLLVDSRLIPLVRLHAWLATDERLVGIATTSPGVLRLDDAFLRP